MNTERVELYKQLPLDTPFSVHIFPSFYCNFKCNYCLHSLSENKLTEINFHKQFMNMEIYKKSVDDISEFNRKLKALIFAGHGEPLLNKDIIEMVRYAKEKNVADRVEIVTNGSLLTHELSDSLVEAGLDRLRVSLQGITSKKYKEISNVSLDVDLLIENLEYFCKKKKNTEVYVKIMDISMDSKSDFEKFKSMVKDACDISAIEYAIPFVNQIDYSQVGDLSDKCKQGNSGRSQICSMPFYMMVIYPDGSIAPCCSTSLPLTYGNVMEKSLKEIWQSRMLSDFLIKQLGGVKNIQICSECTVPGFGLQSGDYLDNDKDELIRKYSDRM